MKRDYSYDIFMYRDSMQLRGCGNYHILVQYMIFKMKVEINQIFYSDKSKLFKFLINY